jgi:hypothetical protein
LAKFEVTGGTVPPGEVSACADVLRARVSSPANGVAARLLGAVRNERVDTGTRIVALELLCREAGADVAGHVVTLAGAWVKDLHEPPGGGTEIAKDARLTAEALLLDTFIRNVKDLQGKLVEQEPLLSVLERVACCEALAMVPSLEAMASNPGPIELRRRHALAIVAERRGTTVAPDPLLRLLGPESVPDLRKLVQSSTGADDFPFMAAAALAHFGDQEILPDLEAARPALRAKGASIEGYVLDDIWRINAQNPSEKLLEAIASEDPRTGGRQLWTVRRAVEVGLKPADIRAALLTYAAKIDPRPYRRPDGTVVKLWRGLDLVKKEALELGVLKPDDLPEVEIPKGEPEQ